ncbi:MAG TPA: uroporphyrinogen-III C-methyltransferase [Candidatus Binatia bacterium]
MTATTIGKVYLVGAGPGDPGLITVKGKRCLEAADAILYDELVNCELLDYAAENCESIYVGKKPGTHGVDQRAIEALLIAKARAGKNVVRLKGGDPFVFGRGGEEAEALRAAGIPCDIVPGVSSAIAAPAYAGIPLTHRSHASSVAIVSGHRAAGSEVKWGELLRAVDTLVILMGLKNLRAIMNRLQAEGCPPEHPAALIQSGTLPAQITVVGTVASIAELSERGRFGSPSVIVVGEVVNFAEKLGWFPRTLAGQKTVCRHADPSRGTESKAQSGA